MKMSPKIKVFTIVLSMVCTSCAILSEDQSALGPTTWSDGEGENTNNSPISDELQQVDNVKVIRVANPNHVAAYGDYVFKIQMEGTNQRLFRSADGGLTFEMIASPADEETKTLLQSLTVTSEGSLLWARFVYINEDEPAIKIHRSTDRGDTFTSATISLSNNSINVQKTSFGHPRLGEIGGIIITIDWVGGWNEAPLYLLIGTSEREIKVYKSVDDGVSFSSGQLVNDSESPYEGSEIITIGADENDMLIFGQLGSYDLFTSRDAGASFTKTDFFDETTYGATGRMAIDGNSIFIVSQKGNWDRADSIGRDTMWWADYDHYLIKSTDRGQSFSQPSLVMCVQPSQVENWTLDDIKVHDKTLYVVWNKQIGEVSSDGAIFVSMSTDAGEHFSAPVRVSEYGEGTTWSSALIDSSTGNLVIFWTDDGMDNLRF